MESYKIIIVEDDIGVNAFLRGGLLREAPNFSVATAADGLECLEYVKKNKVDCILSDYQMPVMDGMELLSALREGGNDVPFIFVTGRGGEEVAREAFKNGAYDYFIRDFGSEYFARIANTIEQAVKQSRAEEERKKAGDAIRKKNQELAALNSVADIISQTHDLDEMLRLVIEKTVSLSFLNVERKGMIFLNDEKDPCKLNIAAHVGISGWLSEAERSIDVGHCLCGKAAKTGRKVVSEDCFEDKDHTVQYPGMKNHGHIILPVKSRDKVVGVMNFYLAPGTKATNTEERLLSAIANQIAVAVERHRLFQKLSGDKKEWEKTFDSMGELVTINSADYTILRANRPAAEALGIGIKELIGKNWFDTFVPKVEKVTLGVALDKPSGVREYMESALKDKTGEEKTIAWHITSLRNGQGDGQDTTIICCGEDITERKKLEYQLLQSQKIEAIGQLAGGIAHDFNNITATIVACANVLQLKMAGDNPLRVYVDQILSSSERATTLTKSLLSFSRKQIINPKAVDINEIIAKVAKLLSRLIGEDIELRTDLSEEELVVMGDAGQIEQVLMNLVTNARDAMPEGGTISISTGLVDIDDEFINANGYGCPGRNALIVFKDNGAGMDERTREGIFEPFFTTKEVGKGTGLGLSIVYGIVKQHSGYISVESEPGKGTTFRVYIPVVKTMGNDLETRTSASLPHGTETVLLAEDDAALRRITKEILEGYGYNVIEAVDGKDAMSKFMEHRELIQLLILDVVMPRMNGKEVYDTIIKEKPGVKALFTSGYMKEIINKKGIIEEHLNFVTKPAAPSELLTKIRETLDK